jgi:hypothetical protein
VFPEEVEGALKSCPDVFDALVIGIPDELLGQRVAALVQLRDGRPADLPAIEAQVRERIAGYKVPRSIWLVGAISRGPAGKPDYHWAHRHAASGPADLAQPAHPHPAHRHAACDPPTGPVAPQAPGRTPHRSAPRLPGAEDQPPTPLNCAPPARPSEAPAREADG